MQARHFIGFILTAGVVLGGGCGSLIVTQKSVDDLRDRRGFSWTTLETDEFAIFAEETSDAAAELTTTIEAAATSKRQVLASLELPAYEPRISVFLVEGRERMHELIGRRTNATGYHEANALCLVWTRAGPAGLRHEMTHVIAMNAWGIPERWVNEGLAVDVTGPWLGRDVDAVCRILRDRGDLPSLDELTRSFNRLPTAVSYPAVGSFVGMLRETCGLETVRTIWKGGRRSLTRSTGRTLGELESAWMARIDRVTTGDVTYDPAAVTPADDRR